MISQHDGILPILTLDQQTSWTDVLRLAQPHLDESGRDRLEAAVGATAKTVVVERHYVDKDYRDTFSNYHAKKFHTPDARCVRLHFFGAAVDRDMLAKSGGVPDEDYLGYCVVRPIRPNSIGRTMLRPQARPGTRGAVCLCEEKVTIQGTELKVTGFPFISQDADATVCAQATLWMLMRYFSNRYPVYPEVYPVEIGNLTRDYSVGRLFPTSGLYVWQMAEALRQTGFASVIYSEGEYRENFAHLLYTYIESGIPVLAAFKSHVVVLFGHESKYADVTKIAPPSDSPFIFSSQFNVGFIGNDDNGIPYQALRIKPEKKEWQEMSKSDTEYFSVSDIKQFVVPLPERVFLTAENFEKLVTTILLSDEFGYRKLSPRTASAPPVLRLFLTTGKSFKKCIGKREQMGNPLADAVYRDLPLPHFIWMCEISQPSLYPRRVLGEVIWDATRNPYEPMGFLAIHYPEILVVDWGSALNGEPELLKFSLNDSTEYPIYTSNLKEIQG